MAIGKKSGGRDFRPGEGGRKRGSKDKVPRTFKASVRAIFAEIASRKPKVIRKAIVEGLKAAPPKSFPYLQLGALYLDGKPVEHADYQAEISPNTRSLESRKDADESGDR